MNKWIRNMVGVRVKFEEDKSAPWTSWEKCSHIFLWISLRKFGNKLTRLLSFHFPAITKILVYPDDENLKKIDYMSCPYNSSIYLVSVPKGACIYTRMGANMNTFKAFPREFNFFSQYCVSLRQLYENIF